MSEFIIKNLVAKIDDKTIIDGVSLTIKPNEIHAIMGPNGAGKSTLASALMGHPSLEVNGEVLLDGVDLLELTVNERAKLGLFLAMQYPIEVSGVTNSDFMRQAIKAINGKDMGIVPFVMEYEKSAEELQMGKDLPFRYVNEGFSGGERKRNEILQLKMIKPKYAILDEIDSGLDVDALKIVGKNVSKMVSDKMGLIIITHYQRILQYIKPTHVHVMVDGKIILSGGPELMKKIDQEGYNWIENEESIKL